MPTQLQWYASARAALYASKINFLEDDIRVALLGPEYVPDQDLDASWADLEQFEIAGPGYVAGGQSLVNKAVTYDSVTKRTTLDADDPVFGPNATLAGGNVVAYDRTHPDMPLLGFATLDFACTNGKLTVKFSDNGILTDTINP